MMPMRLVYYIVYYMERKRLSRIQIIMVVHSGTNSIYSSTNIT